MIYPLLWLIASSFRPNDLIFRTPGLWVNDLYTGELHQGLVRARPAPSAHYIINSAIVVIGAIAGNLFACTLAAYAFARLQFRLQDPVVRDHADDDHAAVPRGRGAAVHHLQQAGLGEHVRPADPAQVPGDRRVLRVLDGPVHPRHPEELDEAARIDGCGHWGIFSQVMLPLMGPAIATTAIFTFIWTWSDFFTPLIYLTDPVAYTVPVALRSFLDATAGSNWGAMFAMSVVTLIPLFLVFLFGQRFLVKGIATTGGK